MNLVKSPVLFSLLLGCGLSATTAMAANTSATTALAINTVDGHTYHVTVYTSFGTEFDDCYAFAPGSPGTLTITRLGLPEIYQHDALNTEPQGWQATGEFFAFHGISRGAAGQVLNAQGVSGTGDTFIIQGVAVTSCTTTPLAAKGKSGSPYKH